MDEKKVKAGEIGDIQPNHVDNRSISSTVAYTSSNEKIGQQDTFGESEANAVSIEGTATLQLSKYNKIA